MTTPDTVYQLQFSRGAQAYRGRRTCNSRLCAGELEHPVAVEPKMEAAEREGSGTQRLSQADGLQAHCRVSSVSSQGEAEETGDQSPKDCCSSKTEIVFPFLFIPSRLSAYYFGPSHLHCLPHSTWKFVCQSSAHIPRAMLY